MTAEEMAMALVTVERPFRNDGLWNLCVAGSVWEVGADEGNVTRECNRLRAAVTAVLRPVLSQLRADAVREVLAAPLPGLMSEEEVAHQRQIAETRMSTLSETVLRLIADREALLRLLLDCEGLDAYQRGRESGRKEAAEAMRGAAVELVDRLCREGRWTEILAQLVRLTLDRDDFADSSEVVSEEK